MTEVHSNGQPIHSKVGALQRATGVAALLGFEPYERRKVDIRWRR